MLRRVFRLALFAALLLTAGVLAFLLFGPEPSNDRDWTPDQARLPWAEFAGRRVEVHNARYRSTEDYDVAWEDRSYDLDRLRSAWFVVELANSGGPGSPGDRKAALTRCGSTL